MCLDSQWDWIVLVANKGKKINGAEVLLLLRFVPCCLSNLTVLTLIDKPLVWFLAFCFCLQQRKTIHIMLFYLETGKTNFLLTKFTSMENITIFYSIEYK